MFKQRGFHLAFLFIGLFPSDQRYTWSKSPETLMPNL